MPVRVCISRSSQILAQVQDRKSTRLNSSHSQISYAVFCLKKKNLAHNLGSMVLVGRIGVLNDRSSLMSTLLVVTRKTITWCLYLSFSIQTRARRLNSGSFL